MPVHAEAAPPATKGGRHGSKKVSYVEVDDDDNESVADSTEEPMTQSFIDDSQATVISQGYTTDEEDVPSKKRKAKRPIVEDEAEEDEEVEEENPEIAEMMKRKVKLSQTSDSKWGDVVDFTTKPKVASRKLENRKQIGAKFMLPGRQFVWNEMRTLSSAEKGKYGKKKKFGQGSSKNDFANLMLAREFRCSKTKEDKLFEFNIAYQHVDDIIAAMKMKKQEMIEQGYISE